MRKNQKTIAATILIIIAVLTAVFAMAVRSTKGGSNKHKPAPVKVVKVVEKDTDAIITYKYTIYE